MSVVLCDEHCLLVADDKELSVVNLEEDTVTDSLTLNSPLVRLSYSGKVPKKDDPLMSLKYEKEANQVILFYSQLQNSSQHCFASQKKKPNFAKIKFLLKNFL